MPEPVHYVYLVPGFFGFANLGEFYYFGHLVPELERLFAERGRAVEVVRVPTHPTASVRHRARRLLSVIEATVGPEGPIHLIGHSAGGLDARLLTSPGVQLGPDVDPEPVARRVRSVVTVATPNRGTPLASFFSELSGRRLLWLLSLSTLYTLRFGKVPLSVLLRIGKLLTNLEKVGVKKGMVDQLFDELLADFSPERRRAVQTFFREVTDDQSLIVQLSPEAMDLFNTSVCDRDGVRYGCVLTRARPPSLEARLSSGLSPYAHATQTIYGVLYRRVADHKPNLLPPLPEAHAPTLLERYGQLPAAADNDGIVPTRSQPWGELLDAVDADHLDVIGHFDAPKHAPPHMDWLATGSHFDRARFDRLWSGVVEHLLA